MTHSPRETATAVLDHVLGHIDDLGELIENVGHGSTAYEGRKPVWDLLNATKIPADPDDPKRVRVYKTVIPHRNTESKVTERLGTARQAISYSVYGPGCRGGKLYELINGEWSLMHDIAPHTPVDDLPWNKK